MNKIWAVNRSAAGSISLKPDLIEHVTSRSRDSKLMTSTIFSASLRNDLSSCQLILPNNRQHRKQLITKMVREKWKRRTTEKFNYTTPCSTKTLIGWLKKNQSHLKTANGVFSPCKTIAFRHTATEKMKNTHQWPIEDRRHDNAIFNLIYKTLFYKATVPDRLALIRWWFFSTFR